MKTVLLLLISVSSFGQIVRHRNEVKADGVIPFAGMYIVLTKDQPFPKCSDFAKIDWAAMKKRHAELAPKAKDAHEVTLIYPNKVKCFLTFDQLKEIACK